MPAKVFTDMIKKAGTLNLDLKTKEAQDWMRKEAGKTKVNPISNIMKTSTDRFRTTPYPGHLYMFYYDPKHKNTLPYYDQYPLIFPIEMYKDRFLGLNMHYLPYELRGQLMDLLFETRNNNKMNESTKLKLSYQIVKSISDVPLFKPTIKMYLKSHVRSRMVWVDPKEWHFALFLPTQKFQKASVSQVYADSREIIKG